MKKADVLNFGPDFFSESNCRGGLELESPGWKIFEKFIAGGRRGGGVESIPDSRVHCYCGTCYRVFFQNTCFTKNDNMAVEKISQ